MSAALDRATGEVSAEASRNERTATYRCACAFAKTVRDKNPCNFQRVGMADNVLYRGHWIVRHTISGREAIIWRAGSPALHAEADECCFGYFDAI